MTNREFYTAIMNETINNEIKAHAENAIGKMNAQLVARARKPTKAQIANEPIKSKILEMLTNEPMTTKVIAEKMEISTQKASSLCRRLVEEGKAKVEIIKVPKKGTQKAYSIA